MQIKYKRFVPNYAKNMNGVNRDNFKKNNYILIVLSIFIVLINFRFYMSSR